MKKATYIVITSLLAFFLGVASGNDNISLNEISLKGKEVGINLNKLGGPLKVVVDIYRKYPKLNLQNIAKYRIENRNILVRKTQISSQEEFKKSKPNTQRKKSVEKVRNRQVFFNSISTKKTNELLLDALIWPEVQERWNNPPYDVLKCYIEVNGSPYELESNYLKVRSVATFGDKKVADVEVASIELESVTNENIVTRIEPILRKEVNNNIGTLMTGATRLRRDLINGIYTKGYTGRGIITGIIDTGIDWSHEDFIDPVTNTTRILYIWDTEVTTAGQTPADVFGGVLSGLSYGTVWTKVDIDNGLCTSIDINGHGTHVSGSAAGNGYATGRYTGMAPNADIIIVKGLDNNGILFVYEMASILGQPCVVNMSYGPSFPLHYISYWPDRYPADGTSLDAITIAGWNSAYGSGNIPVKAAGNDGHWNTYTDLTGGSYPYMTGGHHSGASISELTPSTHIMEVPDYAQLWSSWGWGTPNSDDYPFIMIGIWYEQPFQITFTSPNGNTIGPMIHGTSGVASTTGDGWCFYDFDDPIAANGFYYGTIDFEWNVDPASEPVDGLWQILVEPIPNGTVIDPHFDMWVADFNYYYGWVFLLDYNPIVKYLGENTHSNYIIDEGASPYLLCVGSWVTRNTWTDIDGIVRTYDAQPWVNDISDFSSPGPSRDRRIKPDVAAPGDIIISAFSKDSSLINAVMADPMHRISSGTSMAAPHVSGGVALILEKYPNQDVAGIRNLISGWALHDSFTNQRGENAFGYGKFNVLALNDPPVAIIKKDKDQISLDNPEKTVVFDGSDSYDPETFPLSYRFALETEIITSYSRSKVKANNLNYSFVENGSTATLEPDPYAEVTYKVTLVVNDTIADSSRAVTTIEAKYFPLYPPSNVFLEKIENNLIFYMEYINRLGWQHNPANKGEIKNYRIYRKDKGQIDDFYQLLTSVEGDVLSFDDRGLGMDGFYTYKITSVNYGDKESAPVVVSN